MKKLFIMSLGALALVACSQQKKEAATEEATEVASTDSVSTGRFDVRELDGCKLHIYLTEDQMGDASYIIEGPDSLVTLEQPSSRSMHKHLTNILQLSANLSLKELPTSISETPATQPS